jgi:hypothetical protein
MVKNQQPKKIDWGRMLVKVRERGKWKKDKSSNSSYDRTANWYSHGGWFTLARTGTYMNYRKYKLLTGHAT